MRQPVPMDPIYLDYNSTTPIAAEVAETMAGCYAAGYVNPASAHRLGQQARQKLEQLRNEIIEMLGGETKGRSPDRLFFTSGGTESNNLAIAGLSGSPPGKVVISPVEHPSVFGAAQELARHGFTIETIRVDTNGVCDLDHLERILEDVSTPVRLVSVMLANNETGVIQPIKKIAEISHAAGVLVHCDAVQGVAKIKLDFRELGVDSLSFTAHKFHGPRGIGGLLCQPNLTPRAILFGGFQQNSVRPGTEDVALVAGMHRALSLFCEEPEKRISRVSQMRDQLQQLIVTAIPETVVNGEGADRVPHTLNISFPGVNRQEFLLAADMQGLAISTGSACASGSSDPSHVLVAMNAPNPVIEGSIRLSLGVSTTVAEIEEAARRIIKIANSLRQSK